jgi:hypothetical protein
MKLFMRVNVKYFLGKVLSFQMIMEPGLRYLTQGKSKVYPDTLKLEERVTLDRGVQIHHNVLK